MCKKLFPSILFSAALMCVGCSPGYEIVGVQRSRILVDSVFDAAQGKPVADFMAAYKPKVDSIMSPVVGKASEYMYAERPESNLSNLLADIVMWCAKDYGEQPAFAVYNIGGIRSAFAEGDITYGDVLDVAPFENKICFVTLRGDRVMELFGQIAAAGGEAVSHGVELVITADGRLESAALNGKPIDPTGSYRIATLDFVAQGNDGMTAFKAATDVNSPQSEDNNIRFIIMKYMQEKMKQGESVGSKIEGRIKTTGQ